MISNNNFQKNANIALVAQTIWKNPGIARADIARKLNLYRSTVTNIINYLIESGIVIEGEERSVQSQSGRKPITLSLNREIGFVAGFDMQPSHYRIVLMDVYGEIEWREVGDTPNVEFPALLDFLMGKVITKSKERKIPLLGCCFGIPGVVDGELGIVKYAEPLKLYDFDVYSYLKNKYSLSVLIENDANCTAWLEMSNRDDQSSFITLYGDYHDSNNLFDDRNGIGIGLGVSIDGKVYHGAHSSAGEFCSTSWRGECTGQTGIPDSELMKMREDEQIFRAWIKDIFNSLVPVLAVFDPKVFYLIGKPFSNKDYILDMMRSESPAFFDLLEKYGIDLEFDIDDEMAVSEGAAMMYLQNMFSIPEITKMDSILYFDWDKLINSYSERK